MKGIAPFSDKNDEWPNALLGIYENVFRIESIKQVKRMNIVGTTADMQQQ